MSLLFQSAVGPILVLCVLGILVLRIGDEERLLASVFGAEWTAYAARTARLIPFVF